MIADPGAWELGLFGMFQIFEQECLRSYNTEAAFVMRAMLGLAETKQRDCSDLVSGPF